MFFSTFVQFVTLICYQIFAEDLTMRIWLTSHDMKRKMILAFMIHCALWINLV